MRKLAVILALCLMATVTAVALAANELTLNMNAQNNSGQNGTVTFSVQGANQVKVDINITPGAAGVAQPAHIHNGTCANLGDVKYPLSAVTDGKSSTVVNVALSDLQPGPFAVNVHKSGQEASVYVSCADITATAVQTAVSGGGATTSPGAATTGTVTAGAAAPVPATSTTQAAATATPSAALPKTGQTNTPLLISGGLLVALLFVGSAYAFRRFGL